MGLWFIGLGGFLGAITRYAVDGWVSARTGGGFPYGTLVVNVSGCLVVGILFAMLVERGVLANQLRGPLMIGFVGAYTTFSTMALESWRLAEEGVWALMLANLVGSSLLGVAAVVIGVSIGRAL
ncbi:MAG: fluoride efflux transporter FluC [Candidatus Limnocylindria bacterium]